jgi:formylglycine-generating enzyme required for sulfatase activity
MKGTLETVLAVVVILSLGLTACGLLPSPEVVEKVVKETVVVEKKVVVTATPIPPTWTPLSLTGTPTPVPPTDTPMPVPLTDTPAPVPSLAVTEAGQVWVSPMNGAEMAYVPAGEFIMGSDEGRANERPAHTVYLDAFYIDKTEVTNAQYRKCVEAGACSQPYDTGWYNDPNRAEHPVGWVDWNQANAYCQWAGKRLPTEAEWEKAARGTDGRTYPWGEGIDCDHAHYNECWEGGDQCRWGASRKGPAHMVRWIWRATSGSGAPTGTRPIQAVHSQM